MMIAFCILLDLFVLIIMGYIYLDLKRMDERVKSIILKLWVTDIENGYDINSLDINEAKTKDGRTIN